MSAGAKSPLEQKGFALCGGVLARAADLGRWLVPVASLQCANGHGHSGGQTAGGHPKACPRPRQPVLAVSALRELESACKVSIF